MSINPLSADLDIVQSLVIPGLDDDLDIIQKLDDEPNDVGGLTAAELKAKFDEAGNTIKRYINEELLPAISDTVAEADVRAAAEAQRQANETARVSAEQGRVTAESGRVSAENVRVSNETARQNAEQGRAAAEQGRVSAEQGRVSAEAARVLAEQQRVDANTGIVAQATAQATAAGNSAAAASASATAAGNSETAAKTSESNAKASETAAAASASSASTSAQTAASKAGEASASASSAAQSAQTAQTAAGTAQAAQSAAEAAETGAETARNQAQTACVTATTKAGEAQQSADAAVDAAEAISAYGTSVDVVLTAAGWTGAHAPYTQTVAVTGLLADSFGEIGLTQGATDAQRAAARAALLSIQSQTDGAVTLIADGDKPTVDLPCTANFGGVVTQDAGSLVPPGGTDGQVLGRSGGAAVWVDPSGGADPFWVTFTFVSGELSADKTFAEIKAAHDVGDNCMAKLIEGHMASYAPLSYITAIDAAFCFADTCMNVSVSADGFVSTGRSYQLPLAGPETLGGVLPETAGDAMTQSVGVDSDGRLWTAPGIGNLPTVTAEDNGMYAGVVDGAWGKVSAPGGGGEWTLIADITSLNEEVSSIIFEQDVDGAPFGVSEIVLGGCFITTNTSDSDLNLVVNGANKAPMSGLCIKSGGAVTRMSWAYISKWGDMLMPLYANQGGSNSPMPHIRGINDLYSNMAESDPGWIGASKITKIALSPGAGNFTTATHFRIWGR